MTQILLVVLFQSSVLAWSPVPLHEPPDADSLKPVVGKVIFTRILSRDDSFHQLAQRQKIGYDNLLTANRQVDPWLPSVGQKVSIPLMTILPHRLKIGLTVNLAELRLYHVWIDQGQHWVRVYPIGIGRQGLETPEGDFTIISRVKNPSWRVPERIRQEDPELPRLVPPGPDNPLGHHWLGLSEPTYGLHGTNRPLGIGRRISSGCIRLYPEDIDELFKQVKKQTPVRILYEPIKLGKRDGTLFLQVHPDFAKRVRAPLAYVLQQAFRLAPGIKIDPVWVKAILKARSGLPIGLAKLPEPKTLSQDVETSPKS